MFFATKDGQAQYSQKNKTLRCDCDSDQKCLIAKNRLKLRKVGKTTRPFMYDLNQTPYNYTVEVTQIVSRGYT